MSGPSRELVEKAAHELYAAGPWGKFCGVTDSLGTITETHSMAIYRAMAEEALSSVWSSLVEEARAEVREEVERLRAERQHWLDEDVRTHDYIERLEERAHDLEDALEPFLQAKPMPGGADDRYLIQVDGDMLRAARALSSSGEVG